MLLEAIDRKFGMDASRIHFPDFPQRAALADWTVYLFTQSDEETRFLRGRIYESGGMSIHLRNDEQLFDQALKNVHSRCMLFLERSESEDMNSFITRCLRIREQAPMMPIILISSSFTYDEFSTTRLAICDASLRMPLMRSSFDHAMQLAVQNNEIYCARLGIETDRESTPGLPLAQPGAWPDEEKRWLQPAMLLGLILLLALPFWAGLITYLIR
ncbi:hypothetical protein [Natronohydrobacter thiooxidans]|jgi:hypothetical protein|uniref:hypothetical protein n=1 Tax=Natronohydrobacter thiooxidans TaxID=87172 RepID=UPI0008FF728F|nr:hypothetical protein [Natronohydrobacter thiooxidans]